MTDCSAALYPDENYIRSIAFSQALQTPSDMIKYNNHFVGGRFMSIVQGALLGLVQGLGEFLPVSSSGHLILLRIIFGIQTDSPAMKMLDILLHVGTLIPVAIVFRKDWADMVLHPLCNRTLLFLVAASLPTLAVYLAAKKIIPGGFAVFDSGWFLGSSFLITACFLLVCDRLSMRRQARGTGKMRITHAVVMGLFQGVGMIPGVSRSGSTILGGVSSGLNRSTAARFSFMMSAPAILGSMLMEGKDAVQLGYISEIALIPSLAGILVASVVGYLSIRFMLRMITHAPLSWFALYLSLIGIIYLLLQLAGSQMIPPFSVPASVPAV